MSGEVPPRDGDGKFTSEDEVIPWEAIAAFVVVTATVSMLTPLSPIEAAFGIGGAVLNWVLHGALGPIADTANLAPAAPPGTFGFVTDVAAVSGEIGGFVVAIVAAGLALLANAKRQS